MPVARPYRWVRIDDRLLHGQVALGWRHALDSESYLIVDREIASDPWAAKLFEAALPEGTRLEILDPESFLSAEGPRSAPEQTMLLVRGLPEMLALSRGGFPPCEVNVGGLHHRPGARRYLDYLFLTDADCAAALELLARGFDLFAQDLPSSPRRPLRDLLASGGGRD